MPSFAKGVTETTRHGSFPTIAFVVNLRGRRAFGLYPVSAETSKKAEWRNQLPTNDRFWPQATVGGWDMGRVHDRNMTVSAASRYRADKTAWIDGA
jgi:hypothetical protein